MRVLAEVGETWRVPAWVHGAVEDLRGSLTPAARKAIAARFDAESEKHRKWQVGSAMQRYYWALAGATSVCWLGLPGGDLETALNKLSYALASEPERVATWYEESLVVAKDIPATAEPKRVVAARETAALAHIATALGAKGRLIASSGARHEARRTGSAAALTKLLARHRYPVHRSVLAFEVRFGGLVIPDEDANGDRGMSTIVGAYACLRSDAHLHPDGGRSGLVPVAYTSNDGVLFLDAKGSPYYQDTIEDVVAVKLRTTAAGAVAKLLTVR